LYFQAILRFMDKDICPCWAMFRGSGVAEVSHLMDKKA
jgi:hypothetical protein